MLKTFLPVALLVAAVPFAAQAQSPADPSNRLSARVSYADLNLATAAGVAELDRRIAVAIDTACPEPQLRYLPYVQDFHACRRAAIRSTTAQRDKLVAARAGTQLAATGR